MSAIATLAERDPALGAIVAEFELPAYWLRPPGFPSLVLFILEQQVSLASAAAAYRRIVARIGAMEPERLLAASVSDLRKDGVSRQKDRYLRELATAIMSGALDLEDLLNASDIEVRETLTTLPGIGRWTADVYLLACLDRPDVWPVGDRALQVAVAEALSLDQVPTSIELEEIGERWRPNRSAAARLLWHGYLGRRGRVERPSDLF